MSVLPVIIDLPTAAAATARLLARLELPLALWARAALPLW